jgi:hypothetical protein
MSVIMNELEVIDGKEVCHTATVSTWLVLWSTPRLIGGRASL